ncbi:hypothetical protein KSP39_PZI015918 [Platanthera zijinensis]|uniref:Uncharacterized protein n=1 Tax=Platanthera zijinensis TaxID=2320716 RepID=A0AAP0G201_9ASPA
MSSTPRLNRRFPFIPVCAGTSTAHSGLAKIINTIVTVPPPTLMEVSLFGSGAFPNAKETSTMPMEEAFNLDLRLGLGVQPSQSQFALAPATAADDQNSTAHSGVFDSDGAHTVDKIPKKKSISQEDCASADFTVADRSSEGECSPETKPVEPRSVKISDGTCASCNKDEDIIGGKAEAGEGYLDLLLDAALLVSSEDWDHAGGEVYGKASAMTPSLPPPPASNTVRRKRSSSGEMHRSKRGRTSWAPAVGFKEYENCREPITRSKRGRALVLPSRYRDTILEPWTKAPTVQRR